jgi:hypothetical protein
MRKTPPEPSAVIVELGARNVTMAFEVPYENGGLPITGYRYQVTNQADYIVC